ncbi:FCD domain-containing protein, partial [Alcaligenes pakistanensis]
KHEKILEQAQSGVVTTALQIQAMEVDWALHRYLAQALHNRSAITIYEENCDRINVLQHSRRPLPERIVPAMKEHLQILDTLQAGNPEAAMHAVRHHLAQTLRWWGAVDA